MRSLTLPADLAEELLEHARRELPNEASGLLAGDRSEGRATRFHPARNADASPYVYSVEPEDLVRIVHAIDRAGQDLVAIFHSHTRTRAVPSPTDRREARWPEALHLIAGVADAAPDAASDAASGRALRAWRITEDACEEVPLRIDASLSSPRRR